MNSLFLLFHLLQLDYCLKPYICSLEDVSFNPSVECFFQLDPENLNNSPFVAFNDNPIHYVDLNGKAPKSARQILEPKFGAERSDIYEELDERLDAGTFGRINESIVEEYYSGAKQIESNIEEMLTKEIANRDEIITQNAMKEMHKAYLSGRRNRFIKPEDSGYKIPSEDGIYMRYFKDPIRQPGSLQNLASNAYLENTNLGRQTYAKEILMWEDLPYNLRMNRIYETMILYMERNDTRLNAEEMAELYGNSDYIHANLFRGAMNSRNLSGFRRNVNNPYGFETNLGMQSEPFNSEHYQQFRQQNITLYGDDGRSELTVPFRRYTFFE